MKKEIIYVADNGVKFDTEQACIEYETKLMQEEKTKKLDYLIAEAEDNVEFFGGRINQLKAAGPIEEYRYEPNRGNIDAARTLSHIEQICLNAKNKYNVAINSTSYLTKTQRMHAIALSASAYYKALESRAMILASLNAARQNFAKWKKRLNELETWKKNGNVKEIENEG